MSSCFCFERMQAAFGGLLLLLGGMSSMAHAGSFTVAPLRLDLSPVHKIETLTLRNQDNRPAVINAEIMVWQQDAQGKDIYTPTKDLVITPTVFTIAPNDKQLVRVGLRQSLAAAQELSYRVFFQEVPPPLSRDFQGMSMALRLSIPLFIQGQTTGVQASDLSWRLKSATDGQLQLMLDNHGASHVKITRLQLSSASSAPVYSQGINSYVLAGQHQQWSVPAKAPQMKGTLFHLQAQTNIGQIEADLPLDANP